MHQNYIFSFLQRKLSELDEKYTILRKEEDDVRNATKQMDGFLQIVRYIH